MLGRVRPQHPGLAGLEPRIRVKILYSYTGKQLEAYVQAAIDVLGT